MKDCKGCTWCNDCHSEFRCDNYDNDGSDDEEYGWNEMEYNLNTINVDNIKKNIYSIGEMISWYELNSVLK